MEAYLRRSPGLGTQWGASHSAAGIRARVVQTRDRGYSVNPGLIVEGSWGMGAAIFDASGSPAYALSITGIESRFSDARRPALGRVLLDEAHALSRRLGAMVRPGT